MPGSVTSAFSEPEDFEAALRADGYRGLWITGHGQFRARLTQISLNVVRLSAAEEQLPRIAFVAVPADMVLILFTIGTSVAPICGGIAIQPGELMAFGPDTRVHARTGGASHWGAIRVPVDWLISYSLALTEAAFAIAPGVRPWRPPPAAGRRLRSLHAAAVRMAATRPQTLLDPEAAHGLEQQLLHAAVECLSGGSADGEIRARRRSEEIMVRFEQLLQDGPSETALVSNICEALGISERQLRRPCAEHLGMSPTAYDRLRRASAAQRALRRGRDPSIVALG